MGREFLVGNTGQLIEVMRMKNWSDKEVLRSSYLSLYSGSCLKWMRIHSDISVIIERSTTSHAKYTVKNGTTRSSCALSVRWQVTYSYICHLPPNAII